MGYKGTMPKQPPSVYHLFLKEWRAPKGTKITDRMALCSEAFKKCSDKDLKKFQAVHDAEQTRYDKQMEEIVTQGYFEMEDGVRSDQV